MATVTIAYTVPQGLRTITDLVSLLSAITLLPTGGGELELLGMTKQSDVTVGGATDATRTIVLNVEPDGEVRFPSDDDKKDATRSLLGGQIALQMPAQNITSAEPVVA